MAQTSPGCRTRWFEALDLIGDDSPLYHLVLTAGRVVGATTPASMSDLERALDAYVNSVVETHSGSS